MEFRLLGQVELWAQGRRIDLGPTKIQLLLAVLLLQAGDPVPFDTLVRCVWGEAVPAKVAASVQANLSRLRRRLELGGDSGVALDHVTAIGYKLIVPKEQVDVYEFKRLINLSRSAVDKGERDRAIELLRAAEQLVRGEPLAGLPGPWAQVAREGLQEYQRDATLTRIGLQLQQDDPRTLIGELRELAGRHRFDEAVAALLMRALHAAGRTADALAEYKAISRRLREELGIDPHRALKDVHQMLLRDEDVPQHARSHLVRPQQATQLAPLVPTAEPTPQAPNTLERDPPGFVGRQHDLEILEKEITDQLNSGQSVLCVIDGMPGVGKSALALHLAHILRRHCPDAALQVHLRGHDMNQRPTTPEAALGSLLSTLRVDAKQVQLAGGLDHAIALWRRRTSERRILLLLDDAASADQIRPLIPGGVGSIVLVTARKHLPDLPDALRHTLPVMRTSDARDLFLRAAQLPSTEDPAVNAVVAVCDRLPLALSIAGAFLPMQRSWSVADLAEHLSRSLASPESDTFRAPLDTTFETSYRNLGELPSRLFRRLSLYPDSRISLPAAAALAGAPIPDTDLALAVLVDHHLLSEPQRHRYRMHDLLRGFAAHAVVRDDTDSDRHSADDRLMRYTLTAVDRATARFHPSRQDGFTTELTAPTSPYAPLFHDAQQAAAWLDAEQASLRAVIEYWHHNGRSYEAAALSRLLAMYLDRRSLWKESIPLHENALSTWTRRNQRAGQAYALTDLATARWRLGALEQARHYGDTALALWRALGDTDGQADALLQLGRVHYNMHRLADAINSYQQSVKLRQTMHDRHGQAVSLYHLGAALFDTGQYSSGIAHTQRALELARTTHDDAVERNCINNLGEFYHQCGEHEEAEACYQQALTLALQLGDTRNIAVAALNLGDTSTRLGHPEEALPLLDKALEQFRKLENLIGETNTLLAQARAHLPLGHNELALTLLNQATTMAEQIGDPFQLTNAHLTAGSVHLAGQDQPAALTAYQLALGSARTAGMPLLQAAAHHGIGDVFEESNRHAAARNHWQRAVALYDPVQTKRTDLLRERLGTPGGANP